MKRQTFLLLIILSSMACGKPLVEIEKNTIGDQKGMKIISYSDNPKVESFLQISKTYSKDELLPSFQLNLNTTSLNAMDNSLNDLPLVSMFLRKNKLQGEVLFPAIIALQELHLYNDTITKFRFVNLMPSLKIIEMMNLEKIKELPNLEMCSKLEILDMEDCKLQNISDGPLVPSLKKLRLHGSFSNMQAIKRFHNLEWLSLNNSNIKNIEGLDTLNKLQKVNLSNNILLEDISGLLKAPLVDEVILVGVPFKSEFLATFKQMPKLIAVDLSNSAISDLSFLSDLPKNIQYIGLMNNKIEIVKNLELCPNITWDYTTFRGNPIKKITRASLNLILKQQGEAENENNGETFLYEINKGNITVIEN